MCNTSGQCSSIIYTSPPAAAVTGITTGFSNIIPRLLRSWRTRRSRDKFTCVSAMDVLCPLHIPWWFCMSIHECHLCQSTCTKGTIYCNRTFRSSSGLYHVKLYHFSQFNDHSFPLAKNLMTHNQHSCAYAHANLSSHWWKMAQRCSTRLNYITHHYSILYKIMWPLWGIWFWRDADYD